MIIMSTTNREGGGVGSRVGSGRVQILVGRVGSEKLDPGTTLVITKGKTLKLFSKWINLAVAYGHACFWRSIFLWIVQSCDWIFYDTKN